MSHRLLMANIGNDLSALEEVTRLLGLLRGAWEEMKPSATPSSPRIRRRHRLPAPATARRDGAGCCRGLAGAGLHFSRQMLVAAERDARQSFWSLTSSAMASCLHCSKTRPDALWQGCGTPASPVGSNRSYLSMMN